MKRKILFDFYNWLMDNWEGPLPSEESIEAYLEVDLGIIDAAEKRGFAGAMDMTYWGDMKKEE